MAVAVICMQDVHNRRRVVKSISKKHALIFAIAAMLSVVSFMLVFRHGYDATLLLADLAQVNLPLPDNRPAFTRQEIHYGAVQQPLVGDLYVPNGVTRAGIVLVPGAAEDGRRDVRLVRFAEALAHSAFVVLVPDIRSLRELRPSPDSVLEIAAAVAHLGQSDHLAPHARLGIGAFSIAAGPALLAALDPEAGEEVNFLLLVGGYHDLKRTLQFLTTGFFQDGSEWRYREPNTYGKWVYALTNAARLENENDRVALSTIARRKLAAPEMVIDRWLGTLSTEGMAVYDFIVNTDPAKVPVLMQNLPVAVRADIDALNLAARDLSSLQADSILVHGLDDDIIPYTESISLAAALPPGDTRLYLLGGLHHVDQEFQGLDAWRSWCAMRALLQQRD